MRADVDALRLAFTAERAHAETLRQLRVESEAREAERHEQARAFLLGAKQSRSHLQGAVNEGWRALRRVGAGRRGQFPACGPAVLVYHQARHGPVARAERGAERAQFFIARRDGERRAGAATR